MFIAHFFPGNFNDSTKGQVIWNGTHINNFTFHNATLTWKTSNGNATNGEINFTRDQTNAKEADIEGYMWNDGRYLHSVYTYFISECCC